MSKLKEKLTRVLDECYRVYEMHGMTGVIDHVGFQHNNPDYDEVQYGYCMHCDAETPTLYDICLVCGQSIENVSNDSLTDCIKSGQHLKSCDADGFCNACGHQETVEDELVDAVIEDLKKSMALGDYTVLDELLRFIPRENLIGALPEEQWSNFK